jgi:dolichol-phosphate mannosyltransferase
MRIAVVIPCYCCADRLTNVLKSIGPEVSKIYCVDDACPERSGATASSVGDVRVRVLYHVANTGVGGAVITGYRCALEEGADIIVKLDGDGQMNPAHIPVLVDPILSGDADYVKGNRFYNLESLRAMPPIRLAGNACLSFLSKASSGYWNLFDPTNGFTAVHAHTASLLPFDKLSRRWFFESDMLFRLNTLRAVVTDVPLDAFYGEEKSNLSPMRALLDFPFYHVRNAVKRIFYSYVLRDFNSASLNLLIGSLMIIAGAAFGGWQWLRGGLLNIVATPGTVMLAALPIILGFQALLSFLQFDVANIPNRPLQRLFKR